MRSDPQPLSPPAFADDLFAGERRDQPLDPGAIVLGGFASDRAQALFAAMETVLADAPLRHLITPGGWRMSVAMSNCGTFGWVSDRSGYRYDPADPLSGRRWPAMPALFTAFAAEAATAAGFAGFVPDACLINRYEPGARLSLHQDRDERDQSAPIVSVSLGLPATFLWGGPERRDRPRRVRLAHGDVVVWGGPARFAFHGIDPVADGTHPLTGAARYNLTFRKVY
ncbi:DNA oxidative demethylase AlkB [Sphingomonas sp. KC8]|uniref:DNA oxidative demethylase AlkB n=1 Tax=Sphingomonas sp. KC8 TaxID=1030157 RepID=UPI00024885F6|nr:DNA oxidative demethylase AlkB [Sphingomonas sp. KC8]ARS27525.1 alpha-ketoglutarate-dependent dioxygenase AlkB [Sphingomonas sp. KC8]